MMRELFDVGPSAWADVFLAAGAVCLAAELAVAALRMRRPESRCDVRRGTLAALPAVAAAALLMPIWTWSVGSPADPLGSDRVVDSEPTSAGASGSTATSIAWGRWATALWASVAAVLLVRLAMQARKLAELRRTAKVADDPAMLAKFARLALRLGLPETPLLLVSAKVGTPTAAGMSRPAVIVPPDLFASPAAEAVLAHELAHLVRRDPTAGAVAAVISALLWFQPLVKWVARRARADAEFAADEAAARTVGDAVGLADHLARLAEQRSGGRAVAQSGPSSTLRSGLALRIERLLDLDSEEPAVRANRATVWAVVAALVAAACVPRLGERPASAQAREVEAVEAEPQPEPKLVRVVRLHVLPPADARKAMEARYGSTAEVRFAHDDELGVVVIVGPADRVPAMHELLIEHDRLGKLP